MADPTEVLTEYPLELIQNARYFRRLALRLTGTGPDDDAATYLNFHDYDLHSQVRTKEDPVNGDLILDLTDSITVHDDDDGDGKFLELLIIPEMTAALDSISQLRKGTAFWDIFYVNPDDHTVADRIFQGPAQMDYAATEMAAAEIPGDN